MRKQLNIFYQRKLKNPRFQKRIGAILSFVILTVLILPRSFMLEFQYELNKAWWEKDLYAPFDFAVYKTSDSISSEQQLAIADVADIYRLDSLTEDRTKKQVLKKLEALNQGLLDYKRLVEAADTAVLRQSRQAIINQYGLNPELVKVDLEGSNTAWLSRVGSLAMEISEEVYARGLLDQDKSTLSKDYLALRVNPSTERMVAVAPLLEPASLPGWIDSRSKGLSDQVLAGILNKLLKTELKPNYVFDQGLTEEEIARVSGMVSPVYGKVNAQELVIRKGEIVTEEIDAKLRSLLHAKQDRFGNQNLLLIFLSQFLIILLITAVLIVYLRVNQPQIYFDFNSLMLILVSFLIMIAAMVLATKLTRITETRLALSYIYLVPMCIVPIVVGIFFDARTGFLCNVLIALFAAVLVQQGLEVAFVQFITGTLAIYSLRRIQKREVFFYTLGYVLIAYVISYVVYGLYSKSGFTDINYGNLPLFIFNVALTIMAYPMIYLFEKIFGVTSDLTYLELLDTNHPLLQKLANKTPGTFQHSLQVSNIAESAINAIGGNALLTHVGALYHDIGKMKHSNYFIENMIDDENPHEKITCDQSAKYIIGHVADGVELAQKHHLPQEIIDFIETHHGTTRVEFFYRQYLKENEGADELVANSEFRYRGPRPFSKETAVLMIADSIEAAARSLKKPTAEDLLNLVNKIVDHKISDGQLEESNLTFKNISDIRRVMYKQLLGIYHKRIEYPDP